MSFSNEENNNNEEIIKSLENNDKNDLLLNEIEDIKKIKEFQTDLLILNQFWLELISKLVINISIIIYELIFLYIIIGLLSIYEGNFEFILKSYNFFTQTIGLKWLFFLNLSQQLSLTFFSLTTFSNIFNKSKKIKKFFIVNLIKAGIFYYISLVILKNVIKENIYNSFVKVINDSSLNDDEKKNLIELLKKIIKITIIYVGNFLSNYNTYLDILIIGSLYIFLFKCPKGIYNEKLFYFRLLSSFPISFILISIILRTLQNLNYININIFLFPILTGPKFSIYGFFITTLLYLKYKQKEYKIIDEKNTLLPNVFSKIGSKIFSYFGFLELFVGLFSYKLSAIGIGKYYFSILGAPLIILYDYKKEKKIFIRPCKKKNITKFINFFVSFISFFFIFIIGFLDIIFFFEFLAKYITPLGQFIVQNLDDILLFINNLYY